MKCLRRVLILPKLSPVKPLGQRDLGRRLGSHIEELEMKLGIFLCVAGGCLACSAVSKADVVLAVDRQPAGSPTQAGFQPWTTAVSITNLSTGVSVTDFGTGAGNLRDRGAAAVLSGSPIADLLRDFSFSSGINTDPQMRIQIAGLTANTDYKVTLYGLDATDNDGRGTSWYLGTNASGTLIRSFFNDNSSPPLPLGPVFSQLFNTGASTTLNFFGVGNVSAQGPPLGPPNTATIVIFSGLVVETVAPVPEPTSLALFSLVSLVGGVSAWRRRRG